MNQQNIYSANIAGADHIAEILTSLGIEFRPYLNAIKPRVELVCPNCSDRNDNSRNISLYTNHTGTNPKTGKENVPAWSCHKCEVHNQYGRSVVGLLRLLSGQTVEQVCKMIFSTANTGAPVIKPTVKPTKHIDSPDDKLFYNYSSALLYIHQFTHLILCQYYSDAQLQLNEGNLNVIQSEDFSRQHKRIIDKSRALSIHVRGSQAYCADVLEVCTREYNVTCEQVEQPAEPNYHEMYEFI